MVTIEILERFKEGRPVESLGFYKFLFVPRIGEVLSGCGNTTDVPGSPLRVVEIRHLAAPEQIQTKNKKLAEFLGTPSVQIIGEPIWE